MRPLCDVRVLLICKCVCKSFEARLSRNNYYYCCCHHHRRQMNIIYRWLLTESPRPATGVIYGIYTIRATEHKPEIIENTGIRTKFLPEPLFAFFRSFKRNRCQYRELCDPNLLCCLIYLIMFVYWT